MTFASEAALSARVAALGRDLEGAIDGTDAEPLAEVLAALSALRALRAQLDLWEYRLINHGRDLGASWIALAPALGVASRQAAERRYLRLAPSSHTHDRRTRDERVQAVRDQRASDRAVNRWAQTQSSALRQLAGLITALDNLGPHAQHSLDQLHDAIGADDTAALVPLLAAIHEYLPAGHPLADRVADITDHAAELRRDTQQQRDQQRDAEP
ncbi:hypothetical protein AB0J82_22465 [Asanoa sp. NPDC049518]|uniref:hypothetical protein n=1 Tax=unclassified Asanoa TaxID=2685164 RepID=UPI003426F1CF